MRDYELMTVMQPELDEAGLEEQNERLKSLISGHGGEVTSVDAWGRRRLAYPIGAFKDGIYTVTKFRSTAEEIEPLERSLRLSESVIRYLIVRLES